MGPIGKKNEMFLVVLVLATSKTSLRVLIHTIQKPPHIFHFIDHFTYISPAWTAKTFSAVQFDIQQ